MYLPVWCLAAIIACTSPAIARQRPPDALPPADQFLISFEKIPSPNLGAVNAILRDERGFLWFGTTKGLCKYDGYSVRVFPIGDSAAAGPEQDVIAMVKSDDTTLLLGTGRGLWTVDVRTGRSTPAFEGAGFSADRISALSRGYDGTLWIGTASIGVFALRGGAEPVKTYSTRNGLSDDRITELLPDRSGRIWIGTVAGGLNRLDPRTSRITQYRAGSPADGSLWSDQILALCEGGRAELWIGTTDGLNILQMESGRMRRLELPSGRPQTVRAITADSSAPDPAGGRKMWIGVSELGLHTYSGGKLSLVDPSDDGGRSLSSIRVLYQDPVSTAGPNTLLWVGDRHGIIRMPVSRNPFANHIRNRGSLQLNRGAVLALCEDHERTLWVGLWGGGLNGLRREGAGYHRIANFEYMPGGHQGLPGNDIGSLAEDHAHHLWIGTKFGLAMLDPGRTRITLIRHDDADTASLVGDDVTQVLVDRGGVPWITTTQGLSRLVSVSPPRFRNYLHQRADAHPIGGNEVSDVLEDGRSDIWASTYGRGLNRIVPDGSITRFIDPADTSGRGVNFIYSFVEGDSGLFWLSTPVGLVSFDRGTGAFRRHHIGELFGAHIFGIEPDRSGNLWLSTGIGLARYSPGTGAFVRFGRHRGNSFEELFSGFSRNGSGELMAGGIDGFVEFLPERISTASRPPEISITGFRVLDREFPAVPATGGPILLSHDQNFLSFSFAALDYENPSLNRFAYRVDGVDDHWIDAGTHNYASYTHLDPGEYIFHVKGCNSENVWNEGGASIAFTITPPYWQTVWFRLLAALVIAGAVYAAYRYRLRSLLAMERLRLRIADDLHDDVGSNLSAIALVSRSLQHAPGAPPAIQSKLAEIYDTAVQTSEGMRDIVWFIKPKDDTIGDLLLKMKETAASQFREIDYDFRSPKTHDAASMAIEFKRNVYLAFKEIVTNIVKHARATHVEIGFAMTDGLFEMTITDNGRGFDTGGRHQGSGLASLRKRARALGGTCEFRSGPGNGTTVKFTAKMKA